MSYANLNSNNPDTCFTDEERAQILAMEAQRNYLAEVRARRERERKQEEEQERKRIRERMDKQVDEEIEKWRRTADANIKR